MEVEKLKKEYDVRVDWRPFFLRPDTPPEGWPVPPHLRQWINAPDNPVRLRAAASGIEMVACEITPPTRRAHEAAEYAREAGRLEPFHAAVLRRYWSEGEDLREWAILRGAAQEAGLDPDAMQTAVESGRYRPIVEAGVRDAHEMGVDAVPTFVIGDRVVIQGAQEYAAFEQAMERLGARPRSAG